MKLQPIAAAAAIALLALTACKDSSAPSAGAAPAASARADVRAPSVQAIEAEAKGFNVGPMMAAHVVYVFFDAQCPHCAALWEAAKPLKAQARFVWIPVGVLNADSTTQGAAILAAADPAAAMEAHEKAMRDTHKGIVPSGPIDEQKAVIARNTKVLDSFGIGSIPTLVMKQGDVAKVQEGSMSTEALARWISS